MKKPLNIMLVDDNGIDLFLFEKTLMRAGFANEIIKFTYGGEALNYLEICTAEKTPDLILLDIQMPVINGFEFLNQFEKLPEPVKQKCRIIMISSSLDQNDLNRAKAQPHVLQLITKPLNINELTGILENNDF